jgi:putative hydrolase of the HAD superfamily
MLRAVLFDWGDTLMDDAWTDEIAEAGTVAGLAALAERADLPDVAAIAAWWTQPHAQRDPRAENEFDLYGTHRACFTDLGVELSDDELERYFAASYASWQSHVRVSPHAHALLEALRARGLKVGIVSNVATPARFVRTLLEKQGLSQRVDSVVLSCEVGKRKPHPSIFERALAELGVAADEALFVGDRRHNDVHGAHAAGMETVQAMWFFADEDEEEPEPDHRAFTMYDILNIADRRLAA